MSVDTNIYCTWEKIKFDYYMSAVSDSCNVIPQYTSK